jgi:hypothetical protein
MAKVTIIPEWAAAAAPEPVRIFGVQLRPLSLGRYRLLQRFGCGFVEAEETLVGVADLMLGILICSMRVDEFVEFASDPRSVKYLRRWGKRIRREIRADGGFSIYAKFGLFLHYLREGQRIPKYWEEGPQRESLGPCHWSQAVEVCLRSELGWTKEEVDETPLAKAITDYFQHAQRMGAVRLMTAEEEAQGEANARVMEALEAKLKEAKN